MKYQVRKSVWETNSSSMHSCAITKKNANVRMTREEIRHEFYLDEDWYREHHKNDKKEVIKIDPWDNEFGRSPFNVLVTFRDKLAYAIAEYCGGNYTIQSYIDAGIRFNETFVPLLIRLTGCDEVEYGKEHCATFAIYSDVGGDYLDEVEEVDYQDLVLAGYEDDISKDDKILGVYKNVAENGRPIEEAYFDVPDYGSIDHQSKGVLTCFLKSNNLSLEDYLTRKDIVVIITGDEYSTFSNMVLCGLIDVNNIVTQYPNYLKKTIKG